MNQAFAYDRAAFELPIEGARWVRVLEAKAVPGIGALEAAFLRGVELDMIGTPALKALICATDEVTIVVSDVTRLWMRQDRVCALLVKYLHDAIGVPFERITVLIALGTHRAQTEEEMRKVASDYAFERVRVVNHDCDAPDLVYVGTTHLGTRVRVNPLVIGRKTIVVAGTVHHLMSGYGGGRKSILPGISARDTIVQNHLHALDPIEPRSSALIGMGKRLGNPLSDDMIEAARLVAPVFSINLVVDAHTDPCAMLCGDIVAAWEKSCEIVREVAGLPIDQRADVVVCGCGGYPKDLNLYQGVKSLLNAAQAVRPGGEILFIAACPEGGGAPEFFDWIIPLRQGRLDQALRERFTIAGYIFYAACEIMKNARVTMLSSLDPDTVRLMGMTPYASPEALISAFDFTGKSVYLMPHGGSVVPRLEAK
ncbi:MAG: nickel-dependent lactate racemase [Clostridia bacterium]